MKITYLLLIVLTAVVAGGVLYTQRPAGEVDLSVVEPTLTPSPIDNTLPFPPGAQLEKANIDPIETEVKATLKTSQGDIALTLHGASAPITVGNFVKLAQENFYDGTTFHRVIPNFMIQGGDPLSRDPLSRARHGMGGPGYTFGDEINPRQIVRGVIAMANAGPNTNSSQFFIVTGATFPHLDGKHTVFGEVTAGMDVVDAITKVARDARDNPLTPITITDVVLDEAFRGPLQPLD